MEEQDHEPAIVASPSSDSQSHRRRRKEQKYRKFKARKQAQQPNETKNVTAAASTSSPLPRSSSRHNLSDRARKSRLVKRLAARQTYNTSISQSMSTDSNYKNEDEKQTIEHVDSLMTNDSIPESSTDITGEVERVDSLLTNDSMPESVTDITKEAEDTAANTEEPEGVKKSAWDTRSVLEHPPTPTLAIDDTKEENDAVVEPSANDTTFGNADSILTEEFDVEPNTSKDSMKETPPIQTPQKAFLDDDPTMRDAYDEWYTPTDDLLKNSSLKENLSQGSNQVNHAQSPFEAKDALAGDEDVFQDANDVSHNDAFYGVDPAMSQEGRFHDVPTLQDENAAQTVNDDGWNASFAAVNHFGSGEIKNQRDQEEGNNEVNMFDTKSAWTDADAPGFPSNDMQIFADMDEEQQPQQELVPQGKITNQSPYRDDEPLLALDESRSETQVPPLVIPSDDGHMDNSERLKEQKQRVEAYKSISTEHSSDVEDDSRDEQNEEDSPCSSSDDEEFDIGYVEANSDSDELEEVVDIQESNHDVENVAESASFHPAAVAAERAQVDVDSQAGTSPREDSGIDAAPVVITLVESPTSDKADVVIYSPERSPTKDWIEVQLSDDAIPSPDKLSSDETETIPNASDTVDQGEANMTTGSVVSASSNFEDHAKTSPDQLASDVISNEGTVQSETEAAPLDESKEAVNSEEATMAVRSIDSTSSNFEDDEIPPPKKLAPDDTSNQGSVHSETETTPNASEAEDQGETKMAAGSEVAASSSPDMAPDDASDEGSVECKTETPLIEQETVDPEEPKMAANSNESTSSKFDDDAIPLPDQLVPGETCNERTVQSAAEGTPMNDVVDDVKQAEKSVDSASPDFEGDAMPLPVKSVPDETSKERSVQSETELPLNESQRLEPGGTEMSVSSIDLTSSRSQDDGIPSADKSIPHEISSQGSVQPETETPLNESKTVGPTEAVVTARTVDSASFTLRESQSSEPPPPPPGDPISKKKKKRKKKQKDTVQSDHQKPSNESEDVQHGSQLGRDKMRSTSIDSASDMPPPPPPSEPKKKKKKKKKKGDKATPAKSDRQSLTEERAGDSSDLPDETLISNSGEEVVKPTLEVGEAHEPGDSGDDSSVAPAASPVISSQPYETGQAGSVVSDAPSANTATPLESVGSSSDQPTVSKDLALSCETAPPPPPPPSHPKKKKKKKKKRDRTGSEGSDQHKLETGDLPGVQVGDTSGSPDETFASNQALDGAKPATQKEDDDSSVAPAASSVISSQPYETGQAGSVVSDAPSANTATPLESVGSSSDQPTVSKDLALSCETAPPPPPPPSHPKKKKKKKKRDRTASTESDQHRSEAGDLPGVQVGDTSGFPDEMEASNQALDGAKPTMKKGESVEVGDSGDDSSVAPAASSVISSQLYETDEAGIVVSDAASASSTAPLQSFGSLSDNPTVSKDLASSCETALPPPPPSQPRKKKKKKRSGSGFPLLAPPTEEKLKKWGKMEVFAQDSPESKSTNENTAISEDETSSRGLPNDTALSVDAGASESKVLQTSVDVVGASTAVLPQPKGSGDSVPKSAEKSLIVDVIEDITPSEAPGLPDEVDLEVSPPNEEESSESRDYAALLAHARKQIDTAKAEMNGSVSTDIPPYIEEPTESHPAICSDKATEDLEKKDNGGAAFNADGNDEHKEIAAAASHKLHTGLTYMKREDTSPPHQLSPVLSASSLGGPSPKMAEKLALASSVAASTFEECYAEAQASVSSDEPREPEESKDSKADPEAKSPGAAFFCAPEEPTPSATTLFCSPDTLTENFLGTANSVGACEMRRQESQDSFGGKTGHLKGDAELVGGAFSSWTSSDFGYGPGSVPKSDSGIGSKGSVEPAAVPSNIMKSRDISQASAYRSEEDRLLAWLEGEVLNVRPENPSSKERHNPSVALRCLLQSNDNLNATCQYAADRVIEHGGTKRIGEPIPHPGINMDDLHCDESSLTLKAFHLEQSAIDSNPRTLAANFVSFLRQLSQWTQVPSPFGDENPFILEIVGMSLKRSEENADDLSSVEDSENTMQDIVFCHPMGDIVGIVKFLLDVCLVNTKTELLHGLMSPCSTLGTETLETGSPIPEEAEIKGRIKIPSPVSPEQCNRNLIIPQEGPNPFETTVQDYPSLVLVILGFLGDPQAVCRMKMVNRYCNRILTDNGHTAFRDAVRLGGLSMHLRPAFWLWVVLEQHGDDEVDTGCDSSEREDGREGLGADAKDVSELEQIGRAGKWHHVIERDVARSFGNMPPHKTGARLRTDSIVRALVTWGKNRIMKRGVKGGGDDSPVPEISSSDKTKKKSKSRSVAGPPPWERGDDASHSSEVSQTPTDTVSDWGGVSPVGSCISACTPAGSENGKAAERAKSSSNSDFSTNEAAAEELALSGNALTADMKVELQNKLGFILHALAAAHEDVGYCQGMDYVVAHLLRVLQETVLLHSNRGTLPPAIRATFSTENSLVVEETVFFVMNRFLTTYNLQHMYWPELRCLKTCCRVFEMLIQRKLPVLADHFEHHELNIGLFALGWFQTLFLYLPSMPSATVCHMWDIWLVERSFKIFFRVGTAILFLSQPILLNHELEGMMTYLNTFPDATLLNPDILIACALQIKVTNKMLLELEMEVTDGSAATGENGL